MKEKNSDIPSYFYILDVDMFSYNRWLFSVIFYFLQERTELQATNEISVS